MNDSLSAIEAEIARQDVALEEAKASASALAGIALSIPEDALRELDELTAAQPQLYATPLNSVRV
jgi:hypothetical protein